MKVQLIKVSKEFKGLMGNLWLGLEGTVTEEEDKIKAYIEGNELLEKSWMAMNPQIGWNEVPQPPIQKITFTEDKPIPIDEKIEGMKQLLSLCKTKQLLERQRGQVERLGNDEVTKLFEEKLKRFDG